MFAEIIGYIHVCQIGQWRTTYDMIMNAVKSSGLYDACREIRVGVCNNNGYILPDERFKDPKVVLIDYGASEKYERVTLHKMREHAEIDSVQYWYAHTKGIKHFDNEGPVKDCVVDWIKLMIKWNFTEWKYATKALMHNDTYGCEYSSKPMPHYSGNFWWANSCYIRTLPKKIGDGYCDPEFWLLNRENNFICNIYSSGIDGGDHYFNKCK
jgi:hypothetical protein